MLRWITAGESHGPALVAVLEGLPAGVPVKFEQDAVTLLGGVRHGITMGGPIAVQIGNTEWPKWEVIMAADPVDADQLDGLARNAPLTRPRPTPTTTTQWPCPRRRRRPPPPHRRRARWSSWPA